MNKPLYRVDKEGRIERIDNAIPMSVIEDIKSEILKIGSMNEDIRWGDGLLYSLDIIDEHLKGV